MPHLLLIAAHFAPSQAVGGRRAERMARHLTARGWQVTVVALHPHYSPPIDPNLQPPEGCTLIRTAAWAPMTWGRQLRDQLQSMRPPRPAGSAGQPPDATSPSAASWRRALRSGWDDARAWLTYPDEQAGWGPFLERAVSSVRADAVLVTAPPHSASVTAARIARRKGIALAVDYRDPWAELIAHPAQASLHRHAEDRVLRQASLVIGVSPTICDLLRPRTDATVAFIPNAIDHCPQLLQTGPEPELAYAGTLAYGRTLLPLLEALKRLQRGRLVYSGGETGLMAADVARADAAAWVDVRGAVSKPQAMQMVQRARAGVVLVSDDFAYQYPGKIFDILGAGRPLLLIGPRDCDAAQLIRQHQLGWAVSPDDPQGVAQAVAEALQGRSFTPTGLETLTAEATMAQLDEALRRMIARYPRGRPLS